MKISIVLMKNIFLKNFKKGKQNKGKWNWS